MFHLTCLTEYAFAVLPESDEVKLALNIKCRGKVKLYAYSSDVFLIDYCVSTTLP